MIQRKAWSLLALLLITALLFGACSQPAAPTSGGEADASAEDAPSEQASAGTVQIPEIEEGKFNVAFVYVGPIGDGGWTYAHNEGREYLQEELGDTINTAYMESVPEGADAERVIRNLARAGFDAVFTTSFGYMDPTETVAEEFPDVDFVHVSGFKKNDTNFANLFGAMESAKYLVGMIAGTRVAEDGSNRIGYVAPFPIPEVIRHINATSLGMKSVCPDCELDVRWIFTWFDPDLERQAAESMFDAGAGVVITGADTPGPVQVASERGLYGVGYDSSNACEVAPDACLTTPYWAWGPFYVELVESMMDDTFVGDDIYFDMDSGAIGLLGFMEGQEPAAGVSESIIPQVQEMLAQLQAGELDRFDIFTGPIMDNKGNEVVPEGVTLTQSDLEGLSGIPDREDCTICMNWLAEGVVEDAEIPQ